MAEYVMILNKNNIDRAHELSRKSLPELYELLDRAAKKKVIAVVPTPNYISEE